MDCFDCAALGQTASAVAVCVDCGAGACLRHARMTPAWLTRIIPINRPVRAGPPARLIRCTVCQAAHDAVPDAAGRVAERTVDGAVAGGRDPTSAQR